MGPGGDGALDFGVFAFLPFSLGPAGDCPCRRGRSKKRYSQKKFRCPRCDSNTGPFAYKANALTTLLRGQTNRHDATVGEKCPAENLTGATPKRKNIFGSNHNCIYFCPRWRAVSGAPRRGCACQPT